jgi:hypothetical protein
MCRDKQTNKQTQKSWTNQIVANEAFLGRKKRVQWYILGRLEHGGCDLFPFTIHEDKETTSTKELGQIKSLPTNQAFLGKGKKEFNGTYIHGKLQDRGCDLMIPFTMCGDKRNKTQQSWTNSYAIKIWAKLIQCK